MANDNPTEAENRAPAEETEAKAGLTREHWERIGRVSNLVSRIAYGVAVFTGAAAFGLIIIAALGWITNAVWVEVKTSLEAGDLWRAASIAVLVLPSTFYVTGRLARKLANRAAENTNTDDE